MSTSTAELLTFAQDLVCDQGDGTVLATLISQLYEDELPANDFGASQFLGATIGDTATYTVSTSLRKLYAIFCAGRELSHEALAALESRGPQWADDVGTPIAYTERLEAERTVRLYPAPGITSAGTNNLVTEVDRLVYLGTVIMSTIPEYLRLPASLWVLAREYERESDHRDLTFAKLCRAMAEKFFVLAEGV